jgi:peptidoglycan hydrolase-like protein with peptidoglycan-binding domain
MNLSEKFSKILLVSFVLGFIVPVAALAQTTSSASASLSASQVQAILDVLASFKADAATIANVKASLEGGSSAGSLSGSVTSTAVKLFKANLTTGSLGSEVKMLQEFLNSHGYPIAASGPGSQGYETTRFGAATKAALIRYQKAKGITPATGYFGAATRAAVNADSN